MTTPKSDDKPWRIDRKDFFTIYTEEEILHLINGRFPDELERLKRASSIPNPESKPNPKKTPPTTPSPSKLLFDKEYDEVNRTLTSITALRWIFNGQYDRFRKSQSDASALTEESFDWMQRVFKIWLRSNGVLTALLTSVVIKDVGKDPQLVSEYRIRTDLDIAADNHNLILLKTAEAGLINCLDRLPEDYSDDVVRGVALGADLDFGRLGQAENPPASLSAFFELRDHQRAFELYFMKQLLDVAGTRGHEDWTSAVKLTEIRFLMYQNVYETAQTIISRWIKIRGGYDYILVSRAQRLHEKGFRQLDVTNNEDRALMRLFCMGRVGLLATAQLYDSVWGHLEKETKDSLVEDLNAYGSVKKPAVHATYASNLLVSVTKAGKGSRDGKRKALRFMLRYLARVMRIDRASLDDSAAVVERNLSKVVQEVVGSEEFRTSPSMMENVEVPEGVITLYARRG